MVTDLPFKVSEATIAILKEIPVFQCENCSEYLLDDSVMKQVEDVLVKTGIKTFIIQLQ